MKLYQDFFLISINAKSGRIMVDKPVFYCGFIGAIILDLVLAENLLINGKVLEVKSSKPTGDIVLDESLSHIQNHLATKSNSNVQDVIMGMDEIIVNLRDKTATDLAALRLIEIRQKGLIIRTNHYILQNTSEKRRILERFKRAVNWPAQNEDIMLLQLAEACELVAPNFESKSEFKAFGVRVKEWRKAIALTEVDEVNVTIKSIQPQLMVAVISTVISVVLSVTIASTTNHGSR